MNNPHQERILKIMKDLGDKHSIWGIFSDFVESSALAIADITTSGPEEERKHLEIMNQYEPKDQKLFTEMFDELVTALEYELGWGNGPADILGSLFHALDLQKECKGLVFTPEHFHNFMHVIALNNFKHEIEKQGYIRINEPCCGSGGAMLGIAQAMFQAELDYCSQLVVEAADIDLTCVHMAYLQLSIYKIPAVLVHNNGLVLDEKSRWYTPPYIIHGWGSR